MIKVIKYTSANGYTGIIYGNSSFKIFNSNGQEILHTKHRAFETLEELKIVIDSHSLLEVVHKRITNNKMED